jgi:hypothetical protein
VNSYEVFVGRHLLSQGSYGLSVTRHYLSVTRHGVNVTKQQNELKEEPDASFLLPVLGKKQDRCLIFRRRGWGCYIYDGKENLLVTY